MNSVHWPPPPPPATAPKPCRRKRRAPDTHVARRRQSSAGGGSTRSPLVRFSMRGYTAFSSSCFCAHTSNLSRLGSLGSAS